MNRITAPVSAGEPRSRLQNGREPSIFSRLANLTGSFAGGSRNGTAKDAKDAKKPGGTIPIDDRSSRILGVLGVLGGSMIVGMIGRARFQRALPSWIFSEPRSWRRTLGRCGRYAGSRRSQEG